MKALLDSMLVDMKTADDMFKPTSFWDKGLVSILNDLKTTEDFKTFRSHKSAKYMYVPTYEHSLYKKHKSLINKIFRANIKKGAIPSIEGFFGTLSGYNYAKADFRVFLATSNDKYPNISNITESNIGGPDEYFTFNDKCFSKSFLNYLLGINFLKNNTDVKKLNNVLEIGGGYGTLGEILLKSNSDIFFLNVDIPPVAAVSTYYLSELFGKENVLAYDTSKNMSEINIEEIRKKYKCAVLCPWQLPKVSGKFELFVNFMSFQEMEPRIVKNYVKIVDSLVTDYVLIRNSKFGKRIADETNAIGVKEPTTTDMMYCMFETFALKNSNADVYGQTGSGFKSEIAILLKK